MRVAVIGGAGQLVLSLAERGTLAGHEIVAVGPPELDLARNDDAAILAALRTAQPQVIVNAAAFTAVDRAESESELAFAINARGAGAAACAAAALGVPLVHISTDYVFSGSKPAPYLEDDAPSPASVYGASKLEGEQAVLAAGGDAAILRTAWLYSPFASNFVKTMLGLAASRDEISVVSDQIGNPTSALDLADAVLAVAANLLASPDPALRGVFHAAGDGAASWAQFAEVIFAVSAARGGLSARVIPITTAEYPTAAKRPANSRLDCTKLARLHGLHLPDWQSSADAVVSRLVTQGAGAQ
jgi:dTDP-4-dehydrorhamnose reductase